MYPKNKIIRTPSTIAKPQAGKQDASAKILRHVSKDRRPVYNASTT